MVKPEIHRRGFVKLDYNFQQFLAWMAWIGPTQVFYKLVLHTPLVAIPIFISEFNLDCVHWSLREKHNYEYWRANTSWGQLFARYQREGVIAARER